MDQRGAVYAVAAVFAGVGCGGAGVGGARVLFGDDVLAVVGESAVGSAQEEADVVNAVAGRDWIGGTYPLLR